MVIGVKYCGGCNPGYERTREFEKIRERFPEHIFEAYNFKKDYEKLLLICGCDRVCLKFREELTKYDAVVVGNIKECDEVVF